MRSLSPSSVLRAAAGTILLLSPLLIEACEKSCRVGISETFAKKYSIASGPIWDDFAKNLDSTVFKGVNLKNLVGDADAKAITSKTQKNNKAGVKVLQKTFDATLSALVENSIFVKKPQFRGDCNHPFRVKQPKPPKQWTMEDCEKMDYICGNPPSICHFLPMIKDRNVKFVNEALAKYSSTSEFLLTLNDGVKNAIGSKLSGSTRNNVLKKVSANIEAARNTFVASFKARFCTKKSCDKFDKEIKLQLLTYP